MEDVLPVERVCPVDKLGVEPVVALHHIQPTARAKKPSWVSYKHTHYIIQDELNQWQKGVVTSQETVDGKLIFGMNNGVDLYFLNLKEFLRGDHPGPPQWGATPPKYWKKCFGSCDISNESPRKTLFKYVDYVHSIFEGGHSGPL